MIDSIVLSIEEKRLGMPQGLMFNGWGVSKNGKGWQSTSTVSDYQKSQKAKGKYAPNFEIVRADRKDREGNTVYNRNLKAQFSIPKLLYGTNWHETADSVLLEVSKVLKGHFKAIEIEVTMEVLLNAALQRVDFSKTIILPSWAGSANQIIRLLSNLDYKQRSDFRLNHFGNDKDGCYINFYNGTQKFTIYDKVSEIEANGFTEEEKKILGELKQGTKQRNRLRIELSLEKKQTMEAVLRRFIPNKKRDFVLGDVLNKELSKNILLEVFNDIYSPEMSLILGFSQMRANIVESILDKSRLKFEEKALLMYLVNKVWEIGEKDLWKEIKFRYGKNKYYALRKEIKDIVKTIHNTELTGCNVVEFIRSELEKFELILPET